MALLRTRIERFLDDIKSGKTVLAQEVTRELAADLDGVRYLPDGRVDLDSCSPQLRSIARAYFSASQHLASSSLEPAQPMTPISSTMTSDDPAEAAKLNRELFAHFDAVFRAFTGCPPGDFVPEGSSFAKEIRRLGERLNASRTKANALLRVANDAYLDLQKHYRAAGNARLKLGGSLPGQKLVLGGAQGFSGSSLQAVRSMLMYGDTILIPDPVQRWMETEPVGEAFVTVRMLEDIFHLSKLRPLVDADLPVVPLLVFPSWERLMEEHDQATRDRMERLAIDLFAPHILMTSRK